MRFCLFAALGLLAVGCSEQGAAQDANAPLKITTSQMYVTVRNDTGLPLKDVSVEIIPVGRATVFKTFLWRLENGESRNVMLNEFYGRDGTPFNLRAIKPRSVEVKAKDVRGMEHTAETAWR